MMCCRVFVLILLMVFTAAATCAILFPQFRLTTTATVDSTTTVTTANIFFWYNESSTTVSGTTYITRTYSRQSDCARLKTYYLVQSALSVAGAGFGGLACLFTACWTSAGNRRCLGGLATLLCFLAFACCGVALALSAYSFKDSYCGGTDTFEGAGYKLVEGFGLIAAATGGFLVTMLIEMIAVCCACCC